MMGLEDALYDDEYERLRFKTVFDLKNNDVSKDASIGFSYDGKNWEVYSEPIEIKKNKKIYFKAVRYGWKESETKIVKF
jgi:hypothetical protein